MNASAARPGAMRPAVGASLSGVWIAVFALGGAAAWADGDVGIEPPGSDPPSMFSQADGRPDPSEERYLLHCSGCHGATGAGLPGVTPSLHGLARLAATESGRAYLTRVPGVAQAPLSDADLAALLDWIVATFADGDAAAAGIPPRFGPRRSARPASARPGEDVPSGVIPRRFSVEEVARGRARPLRDPLGSRPAPGAGSAAVRAGAESDPP